MHNITQNIRIYYLSLFLIIVARSLPHAILTVILFDKGLSIANIMFMQAFFSLAMLMFEFPSGVLSDRYSRKWLYLLSNIMVVITLLLIYQFNSLTMLTLAWFIYGLSDATASGTIDSQIINDIKNHNQSKLNKFIKYKEQLTFIAMIFGSLLGSFLYFRISISIFLLGSLLVLVAFFITLFGFHNNQVMNNNITFNIQLTQIISELKNNKLLQVFMALSVISQIFFQTHYQLWQALFLEKGILKEYFVLFYILFQLIGFFSYFIAIENVKKHRISVTALFMIVFFAPMLFVFNNNYLFLAIYFIYCIIFTILNYFIVYNFSKAVSQENISSLVSLKSTLTRMGSLIILLLSSLILHYISVTTLVMINFSLVILILGLFCLKHNNILFENK